MDFAGTVDGVRTERAYDQWIAFRPEQIKSAIGNSGAFDPDNADIRMSRAPQSFARQTWLTWDWARNRPGTEMTKVANRLGQPKIVYHSTNSDFYEFKVGDIGFHFGTPEQARAIGGKRTIKAYLSIHNPLEMADQGDHWDLPHRWAWDLMQDGIFTQAEVDRLEDVFLNAKPGEQTATELAREMLLAKGYDGIVYDNETEGPGQSWIALLPQQIKEVGNVEFSPSNPDFRMSRAPAPQTVAARAEAIITKASNPPKPLDRLARVATKVTGIEFAMGKLYDTSGYLLDRLVPETVKAGVVSDYGVEEAVIDQRVLLQGRQRVQLRKAGSLLEKLATLTREESRIAYEWMNMDGSDPRAYVSMMQGLPEESVRVLQEVQQMIDSLSREAVRLGQLDPRSYEKLKFAYLRRSYAKYLDELKTPDGRAPARQRATRILGDQYRNRGILEPVEMAKIKAVDPEWWGVKLREGRGDAGLVNQKFIRLERRANAGEGTAPLPGMTGRPQGKVLETVYWPAERAVPARYAEWTREEVYEVRDVKGSKLILYRDFTKDEREQMGEIDEARFAIARTLQRMIHDVEVGRYLEWMAQNMAKADGDAVDGTIVESGEGGWFSYLRVYKPGEWVRVPETKVEGTSVAKYGKLAGLYLPGPVWNDVRQMVNGQVRPLGETYDAVLRAWKTSKTALSPAVHTNNIMANIVMADWHDVSTAHVAKAVRILLAAHDRKGEGAIGRAGNVAARAGIPDREAAVEILNRYRDSGGDIGSWATQEIARDQFEPLLEAVEAELRQHGPLAQGGQVGIMAALQHLLHLKMPEAWEAFKGSRPATLVGREGRSMIGLYQAEDDVFRLAAWLREKEQGRSDLDAGRAARKTFLDYDINAPWVEAMRRTGWPFIAFTYRAAPMLAEIMGKRPHKILKLMAAAGALNALGVMMAGDGDDDERKLLPEEKAGRVWGMVPKLIRMPWNDANGSPVYLDIRRWVPVGDIVDTGQTQSAVPIPPSLTPGGPLVILGEVLLNKSSFTGKELVKETDTAAQSAGKVIDHLYKAFAPNLLGVPGTYATEGVVKAGSGETDAFGRERSTAQAVASAFGVKLGSYPRDVLEANQRARFNARKREVEQNIRSLARQLDRKGITQQEYDQLVEREQEKLRKEGERFQKMMETAD